MSSTPTRVILLSCGSFNPINYMHLRMFELARDFLNATGKYRIIGGIVSPVSDAYGKKSLAPSNHRSAMVRLALQTSTWVRLDSWESDQPKWIDTATLLRHHRDVVEMTLNLNQLDPYTPTRKRRHAVDEDGKQLSTEADGYPTSSQSRAQGSVEIMFLCGADVIESFAVPGLWKAKDIEEIVSQFGLVVITRMGFHPERLIYESDVLTKYKNNIHIVPDWVPNDMCSARIRMAIRRRQSARYLVPEQVLEYIDRHNLYLSLPTAVTYDDLASPAATGETSTSGDAMQESSYSIPSHYSYPSTSKIIDTHSRSYYHHHQMCCRALYPLVPSQSLEGSSRFPQQQIPQQHLGQHHHHHGNFIRKRGVSTPRSLVYGVNQGMGISKQSFGRSKSLDIDSRSRGSGYSTLAGGLAAPSITPSAPHPQFSSQQQYASGYARRLAPAAPGHLHHKNLNLDEEQRRKCKREDSSDSIFGKFAKTIRSESKDQAKQQQQQQKTKQHYVAPHAAATLQQQKQLQQQYPQLFQSEDVKERSGSIVSAADARGHLAGSKSHHRKNFSLDSELDRQQLMGRRGSRILAPPARHQSSERAASAVRSVKGVRLTPETCV